MLYVAVRVEIVIESYLTQMAFTSKQMTALKTQMAQF
jgi:hypothetical protein